MKVACPSCNSSLTIDDKKIPPGGARIKCPTCQSLFPVKPTSTAVPLPGAAAPRSSPSAAVPLPGLTAAKPSPTSWDDEPTRAAPADMPPPDAAFPGIPGATQVVAPPSNASRNGLKAVGSSPLPGISAAKPAPTAWDEEATRVGDAAPGQASVDLDFPSSTPAPAIPKAASGGAIPLPGAVSPQRPAPVPQRPSAPAAGPSPSHASAGAIPLPGAAASSPRSSPGASPRSSAGAIPLPGAVSPSVSGAGAAPRGFEGSGDSLEVDFSSPSSVGVSPGGFSPPPQAFNPEADIPTTDDFGDFSAPEAESPGGFDFPELPNGSGGGPAGGGAFDFEAPPSSAQPNDPGAFDFGEAPPAPAPASHFGAGGGFSFDAPPAPAPVPAASAFDFGATPAAAPARASDDLAFDFNAPSSESGSAPSFGEFDPGQSPAAPVGGGDLEFDPTSAAARPPSDDLEVDLAAPIPSSSQKPQGPSDGLEMLSFIDDTAKDAGAQAAAAPVRRFHIKRRSGKVFGPFEEAVIVKMLEEAQLLGNEEVSLDAEAWQPIGGEPAFQSVIAKLMESPARSATQMGMPAVEEKPKGPSMEKLKQLYEGRMAAVAVVESKAPVPFVKRLPLIFAGLFVASVMGVGAFSGLATPYGWFFLKKIFPSKVKADTREFGYLAQARAGFIKDTFKSYRGARDLANQALAVKEYPEARAVWSQAIYYLDRKYGAATRDEVKQADGELSNIELLGEKHVEVLKARTGATLAHGDAEGALALASEALAREENQDDLELSFLRAEAYLDKKALGQARAEYEQIVKKSPKSARALHQMARLHLRQNELDEAIAKFEQAVAADPDHVSSGLELAELLLVTRKDKVKGEEVLATLLTDEQKSQMGPTELGKALALKGEALAVEQQMAEAVPVFEAALKADPKNAFTQGRMARVLLVLNQPDKAVVPFREAATAAPDNLDYTEGYLSALILLGKMDEATKVVAGANARFPGNATLSYLSGRVSDALDDSKAAEEAYKRAIAADATIADAYLYLSRLYVRFRRFSDALPVLDQGLEKEPKNAALHVGMGELAYYERDLDRAEREFKEASELNVLSSEAFRGLSKVALDKGKPDAALSYIEKALELNPRLLGGRLQKGTALWKLQRLPEAVQELEKAREEEPRNTQVVVTLGAVEFEQGQLSNSLNHLASALQSEPGHSDGNFYMARVKNASRDHSQAIEAIKRALESDAKNPLYKYWHGRILADAKKLDEAIVEFKAAIDADPRYADALETLGRIYLDRGELKSAIENFNKVLAVDPGRNTSRAATGDAYTKLEDWDGAIKAYTGAVEADPDNPSLAYAYARLANAYEEKGPKQYLKAVEWYEKAVKVDPQNGEAFKRLGYLLKDMGKKKEAIATWQEYLKVTTDDEKVKGVVVDDIDYLKGENK